MAVYRRGYQPYDGVLTSRWTRLLAFPRFAWRKLLGQRLVMAALMLSVIPPLVCGVFIYVAHHSELWATLGNIGRLLDINGRFFLTFCNVQAFFTIIVAALAGPGLIAPDLANGALPLYFSRPATRPEYVGARFVVLAGLLALFTCVPGLALFSMQASLAGWEWTKENWAIGAGMQGLFVIWIAFVSLVALASSAWVKWRLIAGGAVLAFFFLTAGMAGMINAIYRDTWGSFVSPAITIDSVGRYFMGVDQIRGLNPEWSAGSLAAMAAAGLLVLWRKLRPLEVVK